MAGDAGPPAPRVFPLHPGTGESLALDGTLICTSERAHPGLPHPRPLRVTQQVHARQRQARDRGLNPGQVSALETPHARSRLKPNST